MGILGQGQRGVNLDEVVGEVGDLITRWRELVGLI